MKIMRFLTVLIATLMVFAVAQITASALWISDDNIEKATRTFRIHEGGELEVRFFSADGEQMHFYKNGDKYLVDRLASAEEYLKEGMVSVGNSFVVSDFASVIYPVHTFGYLEIVPKHASGYVLDRFTDESCGCYADLENRDGTYVVNKNSVSAIEVIFTVVDYAAVKTDSLAPGNVRMNINGKPVVADPPAYIKEGRTMVPVRFISEAFGADVRWYGDKKRVEIATIDGKIIRMTINDELMNIQKSDGTSGFIRMNAAPVLNEGRTFIPVRDIAEAMGIDVEWSPDTRTVGFIG